MHGCVVNEIAKTLQGYDDKGLSERFYGKDVEIRRLVNEYLHCS